MDDFPRYPSHDPLADQPQEGPFVVNADSPTGDGSSKVNVPDDQPEAGCWSAISLVASWLVVILLVGFIMLSPLLKEDEPPNASGEADLTTIELQSKVIVGMASLGMADQDRESLYEQCEPLDVGPFENRLCYAIVVGEVAGSERAVEALDKTEERLADSKVDLSADQRKLLSTLKLLYSERAGGDLEAAGVSEKQRTLLKEKLGWFASLALAPKGIEDGSLRRSAIGPAQTAAVSMLGFFGVGLLLLLLGFAGLGCMVVMSTIGWVRSSIGEPRDAGIPYIETFAIWLLMFLGLSIAYGALGKAIGIQNELLLSAAVAASSLLALAWPLLRGISWRELRQDIGWTAKNPLVELVVGVAGYVMCLPLLAFGILCFLVLASLFIAPTDVNDFSTVETPTHPIIQWINQNGFWGILQIYLLACVSAPIVEETLFRGVLYRHLRGMSRHWKLVASVFMSAMVNGFIFAAIHPQGVLAIPALMSLAVGFSLVREWRGSLIAPMTMHALNNGIVTTFLITLMT